MKLAYARVVPESPPVTACDEATLVRAIVAARPAIAAEAESELCRRLGPRVRLYGLKHLRDAQAAADLVQQVLLVTLQRLRAGELRHPEHVVSFVLGTSRMTVLDLRRGGARRERLLGRLHEEPAAIESDTSSEVERQRLIGCLHGLSERERSVLILTFCDDMPADEVANELGLQPGNVRVIRHRALQRLRDCLAAKLRFV
jgi:RNA polymerase sigma-70 factor (ECF subfamily)